MACHTRVENTAVPAHVLDIITDGVRSANGSITHIAGYFFVNDGLRFMDYMAVHRTGNRTREKYESG
jgi:hypothetical protein